MIPPTTFEFHMSRLAIVIAIFSVACKPGVSCKVMPNTCIDELEMWTCIDDTDQIWYEFSDGTQVACLQSDCAIAADEAAAYCNGVKWNPPE